MLIALTILRMYALEISLSKFKIVVALGRR